MNLTFLVLEDSCKKMEYEYFKKGEIIFNIGKYLQFIKKNKLFY